MIIDFHKKFDKHYDKLNAKMRKKVDETIELFKQNPFEPRLGNHALIGDMQGRRAFWVTGNYRVIFREYNDYIIVLMLDVGSHPQVYG